VKISGHSLGRHHSLRLVRLWTNEPVSMQPSLCLLERAERRTASTPPYQYVMEVWNVASAREAYINVPNEFAPNNLRFHSAESTSSRSIRSGSYPTSTAASRN
jgi:hypothetical protein